MLDAAVNVNPKVGAGRRLAGFGFLLLGGALGGALLKAVAAAGDRNHLGVVQQPVEWLAGSGITS